MFERFTERAREVVVLAQDEARRLGHGHIGTEHVLLGLLAEEGLAARVLDGFDVTLEEARWQVERVRPAEGAAKTGMIPFTPRATKALEDSVSEALALDHDSVGTEHILLGLARQPESTAMRILDDFDVDAAAIRREVERMVSPVRGVEADVDEPLTSASRAPTEVPEYAGVEPGSRTAPLIAVGLLVVTLAFVLGLLAGRRVRR